jgi:energy-coupling factor transporter ATP-binding protein EcfA2
VRSRNLVFIFNKLSVNNAKGKAANNNPITILVSTHDMKLVEELFPRTIVMDEGVIVADGKTKDILADAKSLEAHGLEKP